MKRGLEDAREGGEGGDLGRGGGREDGGMDQQKYCNPNLSRRQSVVHDILVS